MACLSRLIDQEWRFFVVKFDFGLVFLKLYLVQVLHLSELWLIDLVHDSASLEPALKP